VLDRSSPEFGRIDESAIAADSSFSKLYDDGGYAVYSR